MDALTQMLAPVWSIIEPHVWWLAPLLIAIAILRFPMLGRGPDSSHRDPWRVFKFAGRSAVMERANYRCESPLFFAWGRCRSAATEADHVMPWSKGGPTVFSNGQALCRMHNRAKGARVPAWWYVLGLERRRRNYVPAGTPVDVLAVMDLEEGAMRQRYPKDELLRRRRTFFEGGSSVEA